MLVTKYNAFYNITAEEKWLNEQGAKGLLLVDMRPFAYVFEKTNINRKYTMEWLDSSPETPENIQYIKGRTSINTVCCGSKNCYVYFATSAGYKFERNEKSVALIKKRYLSLAIISTIIAVIMLSLMIYNISWMNTFDEMKYTNKEGDEVTGYVVPYDKDEIVIFKDIVVGKNPARLFLLLVVPITGGTCIAAVYTWATHISSKQTL